MKEDELKKLKRERNQLIAKREVKEKNKEKIIKSRSKITGQHNKISYYNEKGIVQRIEYYVGEEQIGIIGRTDIGTDKI